MWFLEPMDPGSTVYNMPPGFWGRGHLDVAVLKRCVDEVVRRHEVLRTRFVVTRGEVRQVVDESASVDWRVVVLPAGGDVAEMLREEAVRPFDLARGRLVRGLVVNVN